MYPQFPTFCYGWLFVASNLHIISTPTRSINLIYAVNVHTFWVQVDQRKEKRRRATHSTIALQVHIIQVLFSVSLGKYGTRRDETTKTKSLWSDCRKFMVAKHLNRCCYYERIWGPCIQWQLHCITEFRAARRTSSWFFNKIRK